MEEKFILYVTDETITLYKGASKKLCDCPLPSKNIRHKLNDFLTSSPQTPLCLFIDRAHQDIQEEKLPPLLPWDRLRLLSYKKAKWLSQGGYIGYCYIKQEKTTYLRWIHVPENDPITDWLSWVWSLPNPKGGVFFVPLEAGGFIKKHFPLSKPYQLLVYPLSSSKVRHVIFKGNRLLLSRVSPIAEDLMTSLHFLSRTYPDIHEKVHIISLLKNTHLTLSHVKFLPDSQAFLKYLVSKTRPSLPLKPNIASGMIWLRRGAGALILCGFALSATFIYQGFYFKNKSIELFPRINKSKIQIKNIKSRLEGQDIPSLRAGLENYQFLKSRTADPLIIFKKLSLWLNQNGIHLQSFTWRQEKNVEMVLTFLMEQDHSEALITQFEGFLESSSTFFPKSKIHVIEAPFHSSAHEIFKDSLKESPPIAQVRVVLP